MATWIYYLAPCFIQACHITFCSTPIHSGKTESVKKCVKIVCSKEYSLIGSYNMLLLNCMHKYYKKVSNFGAHTCVLFKNWLLAGFSSLLNRHPTDCVLVITQQSEPDLLLNTTGLHRSVTSVWHGRHSHEADSFDNDFVIGRKPIVNATWRQITRF